MQLHLLERDREQRKTEYQEHNPLLQFAKRRQKKMFLPLMKVQRLRPSKFQKLKCGGRRE